mgnify:CR=1 FL=1
MGKIIDLIKNFIEPRNQQTFDELAVASEISEKELKQLKSTMEGIDWKSFSREDEEKISKKKQRTTKTVLNKDEINIHKESKSKRDKDVDMEIEK